MVDFMTVFPALIFAATLISTVLDATEAKKHNKSAVENLKRTIKTFNDYLKPLQNKLPPNISGEALEQLRLKLDDATERIRKFSRLGKFKSYLHAEVMKRELETLRQELHEAFQNAVYITSLDVTVEGDKRMRNFQGRMLELLSTNNQGLQKVFAKIEMWNWIVPISKTPRNNQQILEILSDLEVLNASDVGLRMLTASGISTPSISPTPTSVNIFSAGPMTLTHTTELTGIPHVHIMSDHSVALRSTGPCAITISSSSGSAATQPIGLQPHAARRNKRFDQLTYN